MITRFIYDFSCDSYIYTATSKEQNKVRKIVNATYLGITPESLSRIRGAMKEDLSE